VKHVRSGQAAITREMTMSRIALGLILLQACIVSAETPNKDERGALVPGAASCGDWSAARRGEGPYSWHGDVTWFRGFVSGHNVYAQRPVNSMIDAQPNEVEAWVDTYCQKNPTDSLMHAAVAYVAARGGRRPDWIRKKTD